MKRYLSCIAAAQLVCSLQAAVTPFESIMKQAVTEANNTAVFNTFIQNHPYVIVKFFEPWCGPCKKLSAVVASVLPFYQQVDVLEIQATRYIITGYPVQAYPTLVYFKKGKEVARLQGYADEKEFERRIQAYFGL